MTDILTSHLLEFLLHAPHNAFLLGGGLGLRIKRNHVLYHNLPSLAGVEGMEIPEARATSDIDLFLHLELFSAPEKGMQLRAVIDELGYRVRTEKWQFEKPLDPAHPNQTFTLDLLAPPSRAWELMCGLTAWEAVRERIFMAEKPRKRLQSKNLPSK